MVRKVLGRLLEHDLYVKAEKFVFSKRAVSFLGYRISTSGVVMEGDRIRAVRNWPTPTTLLPEVYPGFWPDSGSHYLTAEGGPGAVAVVSRGGRSIQQVEGAVH